MIAKTYWNGEECTATRVMLKVLDDATFVKYWAKTLIGSTIEAVEVMHNGHTFYIDDRDGNGWQKVTAGEGSSRYGHKTLNGEVMARARV